MQETVEMYKSAMKPLLPLVVKQGIVTCFAYGQTGSGKTYTMNGLQELIVNELFELAKKGFTVTVSYFEIYGGRCLDLLNEKNVLNIL
jgi:kinesin family protein 2/24